MVLLIRKYLARCFLGPYQSVALEPQLRSYIREPLAVYRGYCAVGRDALSRSVAAVFWLDGDDNGDTADVLFPTQRILLYRQGFPRNHINGKQAAKYPAYLK